MKTRRSVAPKRVDFLANKEDFQVLLLGSMGRSISSICKLTGLSHCQVTYRLGKEGVRLSDYRNGTSEVANEVFRVAKSCVSKVIKTNL